MHRYDSVLVHQLNFALFSLAIQLEDFQFTLEERLHSFEFKSYSLSNFTLISSFYFRLLRISHPNNRLASFYSSKS